MRKSRFAVEQQIQILREEQGGSVNETVRRHGISEKTYYLEAASTACTAKEG